MHSQNPEKRLLEKGFAFPLFLSLSLASAQVLYQKKVKK